jgi:DNA recombination protein RmuC
MISTVLISLCLLMVIFIVALCLQVLTYQKKLSQTQQNYQPLVPAQMQDALHSQSHLITNHMHQELSKNKTETHSLVQNLYQKLGHMDAHQKHIVQLAEQIGQLQDILNNKQARGAFGETQLMDLLKDTLPANTYTLQGTLDNGKRVDCLLTFPGPPGLMGIDAKFPLEGYKQYLNDPKTHRTTFKNHCLKHIKDIQEKYIVPGQTADMALLFLPSESIYGQLQENFSDIIAASHKAKVWIVTPNTLMATLITMRHILRDTNMQSKTINIQGHVGHMIKDIDRLNDRLRKLETHLSQTAEDIRQLGISTQKITDRGEKIMAIDVPEGG